MATELTKYHLVPNNNNNNNNNNIVTEFKDHFSLFKTKKSTTFVYGFVFLFIAFTVFLAFSPSSTTSTSSWFINIFTINNTSPYESFRSPISDNFTQLPLVNSSRSQDKVDNFEFNNDRNSTNDVIPQKPIRQMSNNLPQISPLSSKQDHNFELDNTSKDTILPQTPSNQVESFGNNDTKSDPKPPQISLTHDVATLKHNNTKIPEKEAKLSNVILPKMPPKNTQIPVNATVGSVNSSGQKGKSGVSDLSASLPKKEGSQSCGNDTVLGEVKKQGENKNMVGSLIGCDLYDGSWVLDESYPLYKPGSCSFIDEQFNCKLNGRPDDCYQKLKWKPKGCTLPRLNGRKMLKLLRGKRLVFVGDSLNRNMWESLVCILRNSAKDPKNVYEAYGRHYFRNEVSYSFVFKDYNCTVEFFVAPFLVCPWEVKDNNGTTKETLRLDLIIEESEHFKNADILIFNTGHWWTHEKTSKGEDYYQEGSNVYKQLDVLEAFRKAMTTWGRWIDANINPQRTHVFFRGYSNTHFFAGQWNSGGQCDSETEPIRNETYITEYPSKMQVLEKVMRGMKLPISYLNITRMTDYRKDAHPSVYRKLHLPAQERKSPLLFQDCSHWCLPGVPDLWNELLYAEMLRKKYQGQLQT